MKRKHARRVHQLTRAAMLTVAVQGAASLLTSQTAYATDYWWDINQGTANTGSSGSGAWNGTAFNFNTDSTGGSGGTTVAALTATDNVTFSSGTSLTSGTITVTGTQTVAGMTLEESGAYTFTGGTISLNGPNGLNFTNGTGANVINSALVLGTGTSFSNNDNNVQTIGGGITGTGDLTITSAATGSGGMTFGSGATINHSGMISNTGLGTGTTTVNSVVGANVTGIVQNSATSAMTFTAANTLFGGGVTLSQGTLTGSNSATTDVLNAFGAGTLTLNGGQLNLRAVGSGGSKTIATGNNIVIGSSAVTIDVNRPSGSNTGNVFAMGSLTLGSGQLNVTGGNTYSLRFDGPVTLVDNATVNPTTANLSFPTTATISESGGSFGITKLGAGSLTLNAANSFSGQVSIIEGSVTTNNSAAFGTASVIQLGGNAGGNQNAQLYTNDFTISRPIVVQGNNSGAVTIGSQSTSTNTSTYSGNITLGSGGIRHDAAIVTGDFHTVVLSGTISGLGGLSTKTGTSTSRVVLNANNSYSGGTLIQGATRAENNNALGTGTVTLAAGTLGTQVNNITISNGQMWTGNFNGGFDTSGNGKALTTAGANTIAGGDRILSMPGASLTINGGITDDANSYSLTIRSSASDGTNSFLALNGANSFDGGLIIVGPNATRTLTVSTGNAGALGSGLATLTNSAGSVLRLTTSISTEGLTSGMATPSFTAGSGMTNNTYTLNVTGGGGTGAAGTAVVSGGSITSVSITSYGRNYTSAPTISLTGAGGTGTITTAFVASIVNLQGNALTITSSGSNTATYAGALTGTGGSLVKSNTGTQVLTGTNLYTGATKINGGNLTIGLAGSINGTSGITISGAGATLQYDSSVALSKAVSFGAGGGSFIYNEGATGYTGNFALGTGQLVGGSGKINGSIDSSGGGTISPGSGPGILTIGGNVTVGSGHFAVELGKSGASPVAGTDYDRLSLTAANATINLSGGDLVLDIGNNVGDLDLYFIVSNANTGGGSTGTSGTFATLNGQVVAGLDGSQNFFLGDHEFAISYTADVTGGTGGTFTGGNDVAIMAVPEPAGLGLLGAGAFGLLTRRRRRR